MIVPNYFENPHFLHENTMPKRAYYIPASKFMDNLVAEREASDRIQMLNGQWAFKYYNSIYDLKENFFEKEFDAAAFDQVTVPGMWQNAGYDGHQYTNIRYPFPVDPPYVPYENPCGAYICTFQYKKDISATKAYLNFEGVDSCFYVWLNGVYIGYSQVSHATSEFDVTKYLVEGQNKLAVLVLKWCDGSYLEDQDKFRMSGIFRDVYLIKRPRNGIWDYFIQTSLNNGSAGIRIETLYMGQSVPVKATIYDMENKMIAQTRFEDETFIEIENPNLWTSETPYLYTITMETKGEVITDRIGIREVCIKDSVLYVNGKAIKFRGVNRHESDPVTGFVMSIDQMIKDLKMMKEHNFNAIRTSHYPCVPIFYQLCDQYGFYVIDEADNESHGPWELYYENNSDATRAYRWNEMISDNPEFIEATVDRVQLVVHRDKNRPCVLIWSMGNECGYGCTFEEALAWTKTFDETRLTHYESAYYKGKRKYDYSNLDLYSRMYPTYKEITDYLDNNPDKPMILCEYCHAMGNGPGDFEAYYQLIEKYDTFCGAFVWEWCDHAIYKGKAENGKDIYYYGGDHGEFPNDNNFCMDGLVYPDRTPHTNLLEYKNVHKPVKCVGFDQDNGVLTLRNTMDFVNLKDYVEIMYQVSCDGLIVAADTLDISNAGNDGPGQDCQVSMDINVPNEGRCYLKVVYCLKNAAEFLPKGYELGFDEILLKNENPSIGFVTEKINDYDVCTSQKFGVEENERYLVIAADKFEYIYNKHTGMFERMVYDEVSLLERPMDINIWRAPIDNDINIKEEWIRAGYDRAMLRAYETEYAFDNDGLCIKTKMSMSAVSLQRMMDMTVEWVVKKSGMIDMRLVAARNPEFPELPRFGIQMFLPEYMNQVVYYGMGPYESYADKHAASSHGIFTSSVADLHEDYVRPQENGSHWDCDYVVVKGKECSLMISDARPFSFNASVYTPQELTVKKHNYELEACGSTVLNVDYKQDGLGSNACGPRPLEKYLFNEQSFTYSLKFMPSVDK